MAAKVLANASLARQMVAANQRANQWHTTHRRTTWPIAKQAVKATAA